MHSIVILALNRGYQENEMPHKGQDLRNAQESRLLGGLKKTVFPASGKLPLASVLFRRQKAFLMD